MFGDQNKHLDDGLPLFNKLLSQNSDSHQFKRFLDDYAHPNDLELSRTLHPFIVPDQTPTGTEMTFNPYPSNTEATLSQRQRPLIIPKQFGKYAP